MKNLKVVHYEDKGGMHHNWRVYCNDGFFLGYVHCEEDGEGFGGSLTYSAIHEASNEVYNEVQELCYESLADFYLLDNMEAMGYY